MAAVEMGCGACGAAPGTEHSKYCEDPVMWTLNEAVENAAEQRVARARYELATALALAEQANARVVTAREALQQTVEMAALRVEATPREAMEAAKMAAVRLVHEEGWSEVKAAKAVGIDRATLRKALGK